MVHPVGEVFPEVAPSIDAATFSEPSMDEGRQTLDRL